MAKIKAPVYSLMAHGWLNKHFYKKTGVVKNPYPIGLFGRNLIHSIYYSIKGWNYEIRRTWHGIQSVAKHGTLPPDPNSPEQLGNWDKFSQAIQTWQLMSQSQKEIYNKLKYPEHTSGYNKFISWYLRSKPTMPVYWGTLQRSAEDNRTIEQKMVDQDSPTIRYPFNFKQYQLFNMVLHQGAGFPDSPVEGQLFYNSSDDKIYVYKNDVWSEVGGGGPGTDTRVATVIVASDGSGDYTDIQDGIDALPAGGGLVFIKNGTYNLSTTITIAKSNVVLEGQGDNTILFLNSGVNDNIIELGDGVNPYSFIQVKNLKIDGNHNEQTTGYGIYVTRYATHCSVKGVHIYDTYSHGIFVYDDADYTDIISCYFEETYGDGVYLYKPDRCLIQSCKFNNACSNWGEMIEVQEASYTRIIGNSFIDNRGENGGQAIWVTGTYFGMPKGSFDTLILGNTIKDCYWGISYGYQYDSSERMIIQANTFEGCYGSAIGSPAPNSVVIGNTIKNCGGSGIYSYQGYCAYIGNQIIDSGEYGIFFESASYCLVKDNFIDGCQWDGIYVWQGEQNEICGNRIQDVGLATHDLFSCILIFGNQWAPSNEHMIYDNQLQLPTSGNRKAYSIREYGAYVDYNLIRGNRAKNAIRKEIQIIGANSEAYDNQLIGP